MTEVESGSVAETPAVWNPALSLAFKSGIGIVLESCTAVFNLC